MQSFHIFEMAQFLVFNVHRLVNLPRYAKNSSDAALPSLVSAEFSCFKQLSVHDDTVTWFTRQPMSKTSIGSIAKKLAEAANLPSGNRKTAIQTLLHANTPPTDVVQLTGHENIQSLNSYSLMSADQQRNNSHFLSSNLSRNMPKTVASSTSTMQY